MTVFEALGMRSEGNVQKNGEPKVGFSFKTMLQHTGRDYLAKNSMTSFISCTILNCVQLITTLKVRRYSDSTDAIKNATEELKRLSKNGF